MVLWLRRCLVLVLELLGAAVAAALVLAALMAWRLSEGPLRLESLEPYLVAGLTQLAQPYRISLTDTAMTWGKDRTSLGLRAANVRIITPEGTLLATIPEVEIDLSVPALLLGRPAPKVVRLIGPQVRVIRTRTGDIRMTLASAAPSPAPADEGGESDLLQRWLKALSEAPEPSSLLGAMTEIEIDRARMAVDDYQYGVRWLAPRANIALTRDNDGIRGQLDLDVAAGDRVSSLAGRFFYDRTRADLRARLTLDRLNPAELADWSPAFSGLSRFNLPLRGELTLRWARLLGVVQLGFDLAVGKGELGLQAGQPPVAVEYAKLTGTIDRQSRQAEVSNLYVDFGGPTVSATASARREGEAVAVSAEVALENMPVGELDRYWLPQIAKGARSWIVNNIVAGRVPSATARASLLIPLARPDQPELTSLQGSMRLEDMTVHYFRPLPPVTGAAGMARFDRDVFRIDVDQGRVGAIRIPAATVQLLGLHDDSDRADIELTASGRLSDQLALLDHAPLGYAGRLGIVPARAGGTVTTRARFQFPLLRDLPIEDVAISAAATLAGVSLPGLVAGQDLRDGKLALALDGGGMKINGTGRVGPAVATFGWTESFVSDVSPSSEIDFSGSMDEQARQAFRVSWPEVLGGEVGVSGRYRKDRGQPGRLEADLDFTPATLALPWFAWYKSPGENGKGSVSVTLTRDAVTAVNSFSLEAVGARLRGRVEFAAGSQWRRVVLDKLSAPGTDLSGEVVKRAGDAGLALTFKGPLVDIRGIFEDGKTATPAADPQPASPSDPEKSPDPPALLPLDITFDIKRAVTGADRVLTGAAGRIARNSRGWFHLDIEGKLGGQTPMRVRLVPGATGRSLDISSADAGALLSTLRVMDNIRGGTISISGQGSGDGPVSATADLRNFRYLNARTIQRIAAAAAPEGAEKLAQAEGIKFTRFKARYEYAEDHINVKEARMSGDMLGLTLAGRIDLRGGLIDLSGTIVPLYGLNSAVSGIPVIGWLLTGGEGGGVFAATYSVKGPIRDPVTSVNPLALLAPGFLRELFFVDSR